MNKKNLRTPFNHSNFIQNHINFFFSPLKQSLIYYGMLISLFLMICTTKSAAQIKINEKMRITLDDTMNAFNKSISISSSNHTLRALHTWEQTYLGPGKDIPMNRMRFKVSADFCNQVIYSDYDYSGTLDFITSDLLGTSYTVQLLLSTRTLWDEEYTYEHVHGSPFDIYVEGDLKTSSQDYWFGALRLEISENDIDYYSFGSDVGFVTQKQCNPIIGRIGKDWPTLTIIEGDEYLSFYLESADDTIGNTYNSQNYYELGEFPILIYNEPYFKDIPIYGKVKAEVNGYSVFDSIFINKVDAFELLVMIEPTEIGVDEEANIYLNQITVFGDTIELPSSQLFDAEIIDGKRYGTLISNNGIDTADIFSQILQGFKFRSNSDSKEDSVEILIKVSTKIEDLFYSNEKLGNYQKRKRNNQNFSNVGYNIVPSGIILPPSGLREIFGVGRTTIVNKDSINFFELTIVPDTLCEMDTIAYTEKASIYVQAKNEDSIDVKLDSTRLLNFQIVTNPDYGTFLNSSGDTCGISPAILESVLYGEAISGRIKFAAVRENPDSVIKCKIKVNLHDDTTKYGQKEAVILEQTLKIKMDEPYEIQPIITKHKNDPEHNTYLNNISELNKKEFDIEHTRGGVKVKNHKIRLTSNYKDGSGGHDHTIPRRPYQGYSFSRDGKIINIPSERLRRQNYGSFYTKRGKTFQADSLKGMELIRSTQDTVTKFEYIASIWGGEVIIKIESLENGKFLSDSIKIVQKVPDVYPLEENQNYVLIGGTANHNAPPAFSQDNSHFGTEDLNTALKLISSDYQKLHNDVRIRINDMSLENSGKFDIDGTWQGSHAQHRIGKNADISAKGISSNGNLYNLNLVQMRKIIRDRTGIKPLFHNPPHFHIYSN